MLSLQKGLCVKAGIECYQYGLHQRNPSMCLQDFENIAHQCGQQTFQFALGGCGDPDQYENFRGILEICDCKGIVPNFTTSGFGITRELTRICKKYCGAKPKRARYNSSLMNVNAILPGEDTERLPEVYAGKRKEGRIGNCRGLGFAIERSGKP